MAAVPGQRQIVAPGRLLSMMAAIELGLSLAEAERRKVVRGPGERAAWRRLAADSRAIHAAGGVVDIEVDALG